MPRHPGMKKVAVCGSTNFPLKTEIGAQIVDIIRGLPANAVLLTRGNNDFDRFIATVALPLERHCFTYPSQGQADNWQRDVDLARDADSGIAFVSLPDLEAKKMTGTLHVVEKLLDQGKPVTMYTEMDGALVWAAEQGDE
jgi:hypothetical protein